MSWPFQKAPFIPILARLRDEKFLKVGDVPSDAGPPRRYFALTALGKVRLAEMNTYWSLLGEALARLQTLPRKRKLNMNLPAAVARRMEEYLRAVENNLSAKTPAVRREVVAELRNHILEALRRQGGRNPPRWFGNRAGRYGRPGMLRQLPASVPSPVPPARPTASHRWEIALVILLAFLAGYGVARWQARPPAEVNPVVVTAEADTNEVADVSPLLLKQVEQINLTAAREVSLRLIFNATPDRESLVRLLRLTGPENAEVTYDLLGLAGSNVVLIKTASVPFDQVELRLAPGLGSRDSGFAPGIEQSASLAVRSEFQFRNLDAVCPPFGAAQISVLFNALPEVNGLAEHVSVEPPVRYTVERIDSGRAAGCPWLAILSRARCTPFPWPPG